MAWPWKEQAVGELSLSSYRLPHLKHRFFAAVSAERQAMGNGFGFRIALGEDPLRAVEGLNVDIWWNRGST